MVNLNTILRKSKLMSGIDAKLIPESIDEFIHHVMASPSKNFIVGLDIGKQKCGAAVSDEAFNIAIPLKIVSTDMLSSYLDRLHVQLGHFGIVIGFPISLANAFSISAFRTCQVIDKMSDVLNRNHIPIWFHDERFSTINSRTMFKHHNGGKLVDDLCAMSILQEVLDIYSSKMQKGQGNESFHK